MTTMNRDDAELINFETLYDGFFCMKRYRFRHRLYDGGWSAQLSREVFEREPCVSVLPYDPIRQRVVLIEQFRPGPMAAGDENPWVTEIIAGIVEPDENLEDVAKREAVEEAGCKIDQLIPISTHYVSPGGSTELMHIFCGLTNIEAIEGTYGLSAEGEDIRAFSEPLDDVLTRISDGTLRNSFSIIALQWLALNRDHLVA